MPPTLPNAGGPLFRRCRYYNRGGGGLQAISDFQRRFRMETHSSVRLRGHWRQQGFR
jgi:hypothetical protein